MSTEEMIEVVFDIEGDGLTPTKIHVVSANFKGRLISTRNRDDIVRLFQREDVIAIAHNGMRFDIPTLERLLGFKAKCKLVDTLALSWYLYPNRVRHGLEYWGEDFGVPKPPVTDWENEPYEVYKHRCEEDVKINTLLWEQIKSHLLELYGDEVKVWSFIDYLMAKMDCAVEQERSRWRLDKAKAVALEKKLTKAYEEATERLRAVMPNVPIMTTKVRPKKPYKQDGSLSVTGEKWFALLREHRKHPETKSVTYISGYNPPNPASDPQIKGWLFSLGWEPCTFKFKRNKETNETKEIPQVRTKNDDNEAILTPSVERLVEQTPELEALREVGVVKHRLDVVRGFLRNEENGFVRARIKGLTNTLRFKHEEVVNLPGVDKPYGSDLRGCLIAREGYELLGSDMAALEDRTKQHYMWEFDPEYVTDMMTPGYCPHVDIAVLAGYLDTAQEDRHKSGKFIDAEDKKTIKAGRKKAKPVNYGGVYGQMPKGLAQTTGMPLAQAKKLHKIYWERNWSVKAIAASRKVKTLRGQMWVYNEVSKFWYSLRYEKDIFSTTNQGTGVFCFDTWIKFIRSKRPQISAQFHDEIILEVKVGYRKEAEELLRWAINAANEELGMNRDLDVDVQFGDSYADIH